MSGTFDGATLKLASQATGICPERTFGLRMEDEKLAGRYRGEAGGLLDATFTRKP